MATEPPAVAHRPSCSTYLSRGRGVGVDPRIQEAQDDGERDSSAMPHDGVAASTPHESSVCEPVKG